jgi:uncharacterized membrane protein
MRSWQTRTSRPRLITMLTVGLVAAVITGLVGSWSYAPVIGWAAAAMTYSSWVWTVIARMDGEQTAAHATREDPSRTMLDGLVLVASVASLAAVASVIVEAHAASGATRTLLAGLAVLSVALSWLLIHTLIYAALRVALLRGLARNRFQSAGSAALHRLRLSGIHAGHDLPGLGHRPQVA